MHNESTKLADLIPSFIAEPLIFMVTYFAAVCGIKAPPLFNPKQFGHITVTNIGTLGFTSGFAPLCPPTHSMALICCGKIELRPIVNKEGEIVPAHMMTVVATGDHRYGDAAIFIPFFKSFIGYLEDPEGFDLQGALEHPHWSEVDQTKKSN